MQLTEGELRARVNYWQTKLAPLGLAHWRIGPIVLVDEADSGAHVAAQVLASDHYDSAAMQFKRGEVEGATQRQLDEDIVHELIHIVFRDLDQVLDVVEKWMPDATHDEWWERVDHEREGVVERLARAFVALHG